MQLKSCPLLSNPHSNVPSSRNDTLSENLSHQWSATPVTRVMNCPMTNHENSARESKDELFLVHSNLFDTQQLMKIKAA